MNPTDWAKIEDSENFAAYAELPRKRRPMTTDPNDFFMGDPPPDEDDDDQDPPWVEARYDGFCTACEEYHIIAGVTMIRADGFNGWEAEECA